MRGAVNSAVRLKILRGAAKEVKEFKIVRDVIKVQSVRSHVEADDIGYIRITQFTEQTADGLKSAMEKFRADVPADKFKGYILDLRNNPGGLLDQSIEVVNAFIDKGEIVSTRGRNPDDAQRFNARPGGDLSGGKPLVVLINGGSASASEIVSGALQDHKRATLIGTRSFGKGSVQTIMPLGQDGALRLTTARYYTPSGRSIQAKGIDARHRDPGRRSRRSEGQGRHQGGGLAQGPSQERRRRKDRLASLRAGRPQERQTVDRRRRSVAWRQARRGRSGEGRRASGATPAPAPSDAPKDAPAASPAPSKPDAAQPN